MLVRMKIWSTNVSPLKQESWPKTIEGKLRPVEGHPKIRQFRAVTTTLTIATVLSHSLGVLSVDSFGQSLQLVFLLLAALSPILVFHFLVKNHKAILICGSILLLTWLPALIIPWFQQDNPFAYLYAVLAFPLNIVACILGARYRRA